jgi:hypothetical protein
MGEEREKNADLRPEELDSDAEAPRDLDVTDKEGDAVKGGRLSRGGGDDDDLSDLEIQR